MCIRDSPDASDEEAELFESTIRLQNKKGTMKKRRRPAIVKHPNFDIIREKEDYYYCLMVLYLPFTEENFVDAYPTVENAFRELNKNFRKNSDSDIVRPELAQLIDKALVRINNFEDEDGHLENQEDDPELFYEDDEELQQDDLFVERPQPVNLLEFLQERYRSLVEEQKEVFKCTEHKLKNPDSDNILCYVSGAGGVGKSYLIETLTVLIDSLKKYEGTKNLLKAAPTGLSALNIDAVTCHKAFQLPVQKKKKSPGVGQYINCLLYTSPSPRDRTRSRMPSSA